MNDIIDKLKRVRRGAMFIIEGPSGTGKGAVCKEILAQDEHIKFSVSVTTRPKRDTEVEDIDYHFISDAEYDKLKAEDAFYECVDSQYGARYGTLRSEVDGFLNVGEDVLFDMDWAGARQMKDKAPDDVVTIYLLPPSIAELKRRLYGRGTDSEEVIKKRMSQFPDKVSHWKEFDYVLLNVNLEETVYKVQKIISAERMKRVRQTGLTEFVEHLLTEAQHG